MKASPIFSSAIATLLATVSMLGAEPPARHDRAAAAQVDPCKTPESLSSSHWQGIRQAYEAGRHAAYRQDDGRLKARNPGQQWTTEFDGRGFTVTPDHRQWSWGLEITGSGGRALPSAFCGNGAGNVPAHCGELRHEGGNITCPRGAILNL